MFKSIQLLLCFLFILSGCSPVQKTIKTPLKLSCLSGQSRCAVETNVGTFEILFNTKKVITEIPFTIAIKHIGRSKNIVTNISAYLEGRDMFMGKVPVFFKNNKEGLFLAETLLGSCTEDKMIWRLWVSIELTNPENTNKMNKTTKKGFFIDFESNRY